MNTCYQPHIGILIENARFQKLEIFAIKALGSLLRFQHASALAEVQLLPLLDWINILEVS